MAETQAPPTDEAPTSTALTDKAPRDGLVALAIAGLVVATVVLGALVPGRPHATAPATPAEDSACLEWSDGCRVCQRHAEGPACSLPGIACQPAEPRCLHRVGG